MAGSGNLGDDLISGILARLILRRFTQATLFVVSGGHRNPLGYDDPRVRVIVTGAGTRGGESESNLRRLFGETDLLAIGGGGLLQDTHSFATPWKWLRYINLVNRERCVVWGVGLGVGPIRHRLTRSYLRSAIPAFDVLQVRDQYSESLIKTLGGNAVRSCDVVAGSSLKSFGFEDHAKVGKSIGCSLRPWPGFSVADAVSLVCTSADEIGSKQVRLFTFEWYPTNTLEIDFQSAVASAVRTRGYECETYCYGEDSMEVFVDAFTDVRAAVAMRLHANILWMKAGVPVKPISYAPKVASVFADGTSPRWTALGNLQVGDGFRRQEFTETYTLPSNAEVSSTRVPNPAFDFFYSSARSLRRLLRP